MKTALLLIAHGSRKDEANDDLHEIVQQMRQQEKLALVEGAFLELAEPTIEASAARCVAQGAEHVILLPYFLSAGVHVRQDLATIRNKLVERFPPVEFRLAKPLGPHPLILQIVVERVREAQQSEW
jgi:sirohydrochlorin ferrochelatase